MTLDGTYHRADDVVLLPPPNRQTPIMLGSNGRRMLSIALPHVQAWNTWWDDYHNTPEGLAKLIEEIGMAGLIRPAARACSSRSTVPASATTRASGRSSRRGSPSTSANWARPAPTR